MDDRKKIVSLSLAAGVLITFVVISAVALFVAYTGGYNIAATENHTAITRWLFDTTFHSSVKSRAEDITAPERFTPEMVAAGASPYKSMCQHCHAGPGVERAKWASGMRPRPPHLAEAAAQWEAREVFWLVKHGVKMSGMPSFGPTHDDQTLWSITAFVKALPALTPEEYAAVGGSDDKRSQPDAGTPSGTPEGGR